MPLGTQGSAVFRARGRRDAHGGGRGRYMRAARGQDSSLTPDLSDQDRIRRGR